MFFGQDWWCRSQNMAKPPKNTQLYKHIYKEHMLIIPYLFTFLTTHNINIPSRRFPYVRFAQFHHHHQVHLKFISCGKNQVFLCSMRKMMWKMGGNWVVFLEKSYFACVFHPILTENYVKFNIVWNRLCPHNLCDRIKIGKRKRGLRGTFKIGKRKRVLA